jgi:hypothetical protein
MYGRSCVYLLAFFALVLAPALLRSQARRIGAPPDLAVPFSRRGLQPPDRGPSRTDPTSHLRRRLPISGGARFPPSGSRRGHYFFGHGHLDRSPSGHSRPGGRDCGHHVPHRKRNPRSHFRRGFDRLAMDWPVVGGQRYRLCERVLLFLYPPSKLGLTSCVAGSVGRFTIDAQGRILLSAQHLSAFRSSPILRGKSRLRLRPWRPSRFTSDK